ncbi:MAG: DUF871 domain-containing protein, partial [Oscillospiraceae bacterium]|nr:DUF871 domain-containing protein [Oscillospiraceae bacterium]
KAIKQVMDLAYTHVDLPAGFSDMYASLIPHGDLLRIPFKIHLDPGITQKERDVLFGYPTHNDMGDCLNYVLRSRFTRMTAKGKTFTPRQSPKKVFTRGDVVVVNDNCKHYAGEVQIVLKDMKDDGQHNYVGTIDPSEIVILNHMGAKDVFTFIEA